MAHTCRYSWLSCYPARFNAFFHVVHRSRMRNPKKFEKRAGYQLRPTVPRVTFTGKFEEGEIKYNLNGPLLLSGGSVQIYFGKGPDVLDPTETRDAL